MNYVRATRSQAVVLVCISPWLLLINRIYIEGTDGNNLVAFHEREQRKKVQKESMKLLLLLRTVVGVTLICSFLATASG
jgi:hypothetical protein